jgi:hypothetical protein
MRNKVMAGAAAVGAALMGGALVYFVREKMTDEPDFRALASDGDFQIRGYPAMTVAETVVFGPRKWALDEGYRALSDYISAKGRDGERLPMMVPVMMDSGDPMASDPPLFDDELEGGWRTRFVMPAGRSKTDLPAPSEGVELVELEQRRVGVVSFAGRPGDRGLAEQEDRLRGWLARRGEASEAEPEYAFYNSPVIPGPLRRNEVWVPLS